MLDENIKTALVTGAGRGIGRAIAMSLAHAGYKVFLAGRGQDSLREVESEICKQGNVAERIHLDLTDSASIESCARQVSDRESSLHILVNCGGQYDRGSIADTPVSNLRALFEVNVFGVLQLTRSLLPALIRGSADIVFINSTIVFSGAADVGYYGATQHALRDLADTLRSEINDQGPRVMSIFPGRTATPRQERIFDMERKTYEPDRLLQPEDIAELVTACVRLPRTAEVMELRLRPRQKSGS